MHVAGNTLKINNALKAFGFYLGLFICIFVFICLWFFFNKTHEQTTGNNYYNCIASLGRNFRACWWAEERPKAREKRNVISLDLKSVTESVSRTVFSFEFQTAGAEHRKTCFANVVVVAGWRSIVMADCRLWLCSGLGDVMCCICELTSNHFVCLSHAGIVWK